MNLHFSSESGWPGYPRHAYARVDQVEPVNLEAADEIVIHLDAVDADWRGFGRGNLLSLDPRDENRWRLESFWAARFDHHRSHEDDEADPYEEVPLYTIVLTLHRAHPWLPYFLGWEVDWLELHLDDFGEVEVDVFGGLFQAPVFAQMRSPPRPAPNPAALSLVFDMDTWPDARDSDVKAALDGRSAIEQLVMFDIGQGSASALVCDQGYPVYYYDVGCGVYHNTKTCPATVSFCTCNSPPVILSHWDTDHWAGAAKDTSLQALTWIAPRQKVGPRHNNFGNSILKAGGTILILRTATTTLGWGTGQTFELRRGTSTLPKDRNGSGLALIAKDQNSGGTWLLTGDAAYDLIPGALPAAPNVVVVPHHGADMGPTSIPPAPPPPPAYHRLLYSFGPGNRNGRSRVQHPTDAAMIAHAAAGWWHGAWTSPTPGTVKPGAQVLATATHAATHDDGAMAGWTSTPPTPTHLSTCPSAMPVTQK